MPHPTTRLALLFTDIEGSTRLAQLWGTRWPDVVRDHREVCRDVWRRRGAREVDTAGDGFFVVLATAADAVRAAVDAQRALGGRAWPDGGSVQVRMGLHVGDVVAYDGGFVGYEVHRAARITAAAHGGQVLVSAECVAALGDAGRTVVEGLELLDLGHHPLKDLAADEHLRQVVAPGLRRDFPLVRSVGRGGADAAVPATIRSAVDVAPGAVELDDGRLVPVTGAGLRIGRTPDNDLVLSDRAVSRRHCAITATNGGFVVTDLASTHGTSVNDVRLTASRLLADGDRLTVGGTGLAFRWPAGPPIVGN